MEMSVFQYSKMFWNFLKIYIHVKYHLLINQVISFFSTKASYDYVNSSPKALSKMSNRGTCEVNAGFSFLGSLKKESKHLLLYKM